MSKFTREGDTVPKEEEEGEEEEGIVKRVALDLGELLILRFCTRYLLL